MVTTRQPAILTSLGPPPARKTEQTLISAYRNDAVPQIREDASVVLEIGYGLKQRAHVLEFIHAARQFRAAATVHVYGRTRDAIDGARWLLSSVWQQPDGQPAEQADAVLYRAWLARERAMEVFR